MTRWGSYPTPLMNVLVPWETVPMTAAAELAALRERRAEMQRTVHDIDRAMRFSNDAVEDARAALAQAERERLGGGDPGAVASAERALTEARTAATDDTSRERLQGARAALQDLDGEITRFASRNYRELRDEHAQRATEAAAAIDRALSALLSAYEQRQRVETQAADLWRLVAAPRANLTPASRAQRIVRDAEGLLMAGGDPCRCCRRATYPTAPRSRCRSPTTTPTSWP